MWILLAFIGAISQAVGGALQKKTLQIRDDKIFIAAFTSLLSGLLLAFLYFFQNGSFFFGEPLSPRFWQAMFWYVSLNVIASYFILKALSLAELNHLMPFMTLTSLTLIIPPIFLLKELPSPPAFAGMLAVVAGALVMNISSRQYAWIKNIFFKKNIEKKKIIASKDQRILKSNRRGTLFFLITAVCYTFTPTASKISIQESSVFFATYLVLILIGISFLIVYFLKIAVNRNSLQNVFARISKKNLGLFFALMIAGVLINMADTTATNTALSKAQVSHVFAIRRTMPIFAFALGYFIFKERANLPKKIIATFLMSLGSILIILSS